MTDLVTVTVQIPYDKAKKLKKWATESGYTFHRYMQKILNELAAGNPHIYTHSHVMPSDSNIEALTETLVFQIPLRLGQRLHSAARQMRDPSGQPVSPAWLARHLMLHLCHKRSDIMQRLKTEVNPEYVDHVPFPARTVLRAGQVFYPLPIKCTLDGRNAIYGAANERGMSATALCAKILDRALPAWPE